MDAVCQPTGRLSNHRRGFLRCTGALQEKPKYPPADSAGGGGGRADERCERSTALEVPLGDRSTNNPARAVSAVRSLRLRSPPPPFSRLKSRPFTGFKREDLLGVRLRATKLLLMARVRGQRPACPPESAQTEGIQHRNGCTSCAFDCSHRLVGDVYNTG